MENACADRNYVEVPFFWAARAPELDLSQKLYSWMAGV